MTPDDVLDSLLERVGPEGTLLFPLFNFKWCQGVSFDIRRTPSNNGALSEAARLHPDSVRTKHPIVGFAVIGKHKDSIENCDNKDGFGRGSPFSEVTNQGGKSVAIDLPEYMAMTHYHHFERLHSVEYRYTKQFSAPYTYSDGMIGNPTYSLFVRKQGVITYVDVMGEKMWDDGLYEGNRPGIGDGMRSINAVDFYRAVTNVIRKDKAKGLLWREAKSFDA